MGHRQTGYRGQIPYETDFLYAQRFEYEALGLALLDILGSSTVFGGLACTPTSPASLSVNIGPGRIYSKQHLDDTAWGQIAGAGGLALDTNADHSILKQGLFRDTTPFALTPPVTAGQSVVYLFEAQFQTADAAGVTSQFYNTDNPNAPITAVVSPSRLDKCVVQVKAGAPATTGSQVAPTVDAGWIPLWAVTVAYGATTITAGNIVAAAGAPAITIGGGGGGGTGQAAWQVVAANYNINAAAKDRLIFDTTSGVLIATLPASPAFGDECWIMGNFGTNKLTIARNGKTIAGIAADFDLNKDNLLVHLVYGGSNNWRVGNG